MPILYGLIGIGLLPIRLGLSVDMSQQPKVLLTLQILFVRFHWQPRWNPKWGTQGLNWLLQGRSRVIPPIGQTLKILKSHLRFENFRVQVRVGLRDAAQTALLAAGLYTALQLLGNGLVKPEGRARVRVMPDYRQPCFVLNGDMAISARVGLLAHAGAMILIQFVQETLRKKQTPRLPAAQREG